MTFKELQKNSEPHFLSISIDRFLSKLKRSFFRKLSAFFAIASFALSFNSSIIYFGRADALFFLFADLYLILFFLEVFYRSMSNEGVRVRVEESLVDEGVHLDHALSSLLYDTDEIDVSRAFFDTEVGRKIFEYLKVEMGDKEDFIYRNRVPIIASSLDLGEGFVGLSRYAGAVYDADKGLRNFLSEKGKDRANFVESAERVSKIWEEARRQERFWGRENLGVIPSIGSMFLFSSSKEDLTSRFLAKITLSDPDTISTVSEEVLLSVEESLERSPTANVIIVSDDPTLAFACLKKLSRKIELGSILPSLEHRPLRRLEWQTLLEEVKSIGGNAEMYLKSVIEEAVLHSSLVYIADLPGFISRSKALGLNLPAFLMPYLSSDKLQIIASSSVADYRFFLETNPTLNQKFVKIEIA